jgi:CheY-like chemotaxis protein
MARVLLVDDDGETREAVRWVLEESGHEVAEASSGQAALDFLRASHDPLVVLLDLLMTDGDGVTVLRAARDDAPLATRHRYLVLTAMPLTQVHLPDDLRSLLARPVLSKPFDLDELLAAVAQAATQLPST